MSELKTTNILILTKNKDLFKLISDTILKRSDIRNRICLPILNIKPFEPIMLYPENNNVHTYAQTLKPPPLPHISDTLVNDKATNSLPNKKVNVFILDNRLPIEMLITRIANQRLDDLDITKGIIEVIDWQSYKVMLNGSNSCKIKNKKLKRLLRGY